MKLTLIAAALVLALAGCEKQQTAPSARKPDTKAWDAANNPYVVPGWKSGDEASWDAQLRARAQRQNEYLRTSQR